MLPISTELLAGLIDETEVAVWLVVEPPVDDRTPVAVTPLTSYIETEPATDWEKLAEMVSAPVLFAFAYQM